MCIRDSYIFDERFFEDDQFTPAMIDFVDTNKISQNVEEAEKVKTNCNNRAIAINAILADRAEEEAEKKQQE